MNQDVQIIKELAEEFTFRTYGTEIPKGLCFSTCFPLSILFDLHQIKHKISSGKSKKEGGVDHFWLTLLEIEDTIVDPTIRQFDRINQQQNESFNGKKYVGSMDRVYVGKRNQNPVSEKFEPDGLELKDWFDNSYCCWRELLINDSQRPDLTESLKEWLNLINVKTAYVLYASITKKTLADQFIKKKKCRYYFLPIFKFLQNKKLFDKPYIDRLITVQPKDFESFIKEALAFKH